jgi:hypothetical protein
MGKESEQPDQLVEIDPGENTIDDLVREFFSLREEGSPVCPNCGRELDFDFVYSETVEIEITCRQCQERWFWNQHRPERPWSQLHLQYFSERYRAGQPIHCPFDDCQVCVLEHSGGMIEFRCLFCNRRGSLKGYLTGEAG